MEQKQLETGSSRESAGELRRRILDLEEQNRVLDAFIENSTDAIQISDRNLVTLRINRAYEVLTGIRRDELVGVPVEELVKNHLISESCGAIVAETKKPHTIVQTFYRTGRSAHVSCTPVFDSCGEIEFYICNDRDLNEISSLQQELDKIRGLNDQYLQELESIKAQMGDRNKLIVADKEMLKVLALAARRRRLAPARLLGRGPGFWAAVGLAAVFLVVGALAAANFQRAFVVFHTLFFPGKTNWIFDWRTDPIILLLPEDFFRNCAILILVLLVFWCAVLIAADLLAGRREKKRRADAAPACPGCRP